MNMKRFHEAEMASNSNSYLFVNINSMSDMDFSTQKI